jgi:glucose/arabinose dehydrogenase
MKSFHCFLTAIGCVFLLCPSAFAQVYPSNFSQVPVATGIANPTVMAFAPDGRIFVAQQNGVLHVIKNGVKLATPALQLTVNSNGERGLIGIALHPSFSTNGVIYFYYTIPDGSHNRISRFTMNGDVINPGSEQIIFEIDQLGTSQNHNGGAMHFKGDKLYIATGDNNNSGNSQDLSNTLGKLLRINANGSIPGDNPFYSSTGTRQRNSIWAYGLRNPYTFDVQPGSGRVLVNDVGQVTWEEVNDATVKGKNFGWPGSEGMTSIEGHASPIYTYPHGSGDGVGCAITGGVFFNPSTTNYPSTYIGKYFFQDYCNGWINYIDVTTGAVRYSFATGLPAQALALDVSPDGHLYYLTRTGILYKIVYTPGSGGNSPPVITDQPDNIFAAIGQSATFSVSATGTAPLSYQWRKNGVNIAGALSSTYTIPSVQASDAGQYSVHVYNSFGQVFSSAASLTINPNSLPQPQITNPVAGAMYGGGDIISFSGTASDAEDGTLPASAFSWTVVFHHDTHVHDGPPLADGVRSGSFAIPTSGETSFNVFYRLHLTVTDSEGLSNSVYVDIKPYIRVMTMRTDPSGLNLTIDGQPITTTSAIKSVQGIERTIGVVNNQTLNGTSYAFASWAHGGPASQLIPTPINNTTYTANFSKALTAPWRTTDIGKHNLFGNASITSGTFTLSASGRDIYNNDDHFRFVYQPITGDCDIRARVTGLTNTNAWAKAGVMIRETLQPDSKNATTLITPSGSTSFQRRLTTTGTTTANNSSAAIPAWVRLVRSGGTFSAYTSMNGSTWTPLGSPVTVSMSSTAFVGLVVTSHNSNALCTATLTNVSVITGSGTTMASHELTDKAEVEADAVSVYPNPANGYSLFVRIRAKDFASAKIQILNALGQVIKDEGIQSAGADSVHEIDIQDIRKGLYRVSIVSGTRKLSASFVRE